MSAQMEEILECNRTFVAEGQYEHSCKPSAAASRYQGAWLSMDPVTGRLDPVAAA